MAGLCCIGHATLQQRLAMQLQRMRHAMLCHAAPDVGIALPPFYLQTFTAGMILWRCVLGS